MATVAWRIYLAENPDRLGDVVKRVHYFYEWVAYLFANMDWSPKHDFELFARGFERTNLHFPKNSLI